MSEELSIVTELRINEKLRALLAEIMVVSGKTPYLKTANGCMQYMGRAQETRVRKILKSLADLGCNL